MHKYILIVMNCAGEEIHRYLSSSRNICTKFSLEIFQSYSAGPESKDVLENKLRKADVVIAQNVISVSWMRNEAMKECMKPGSRFIELAFWRFDGFWPYTITPFSHVIQYVYDEFPVSRDYDAYINFPISRNIIEANFQVSVEKFKKIEIRSELKMLDFLLTNYQNIDMFTDSWQPTSIFFFEVSKYIIREIGEEIDIFLMPNTGVNALRHRLVNNDVRRVLGFERFDPLLYYVDRWMTQDLYYHLSQVYATSGLSFDRHDQMTSYMNKFFDNFAELSDRPNRNKLSVSPPKYTLLDKFKSVFRKSGAVDVEIDLGDQFSVYAIEFQGSKSDDIDRYIKNMAISSYKSEGFMPIHNILGNMRHSKDSTYYHLGKSTLVRYCQLRLNQNVPEGSLLLPIFKYKAWHRCS